MPCHTCSARPGSAVGNCGTGWCEASGPAMQIAGVQQDAVVVPTSVHSVHCIHTPEHARHHPHARPHGFALHQHKHSWAQSVVACYRPGLGWGTGCCRARRFPGRMRSTAPTAAAEGGASRRGHCQVVPVNNRAHGGCCSEQVPPHGGLSQRR